MQRDGYENLEIIGSGYFDFSAYPLVNVMDHSFVGFKIGDERFIADPTYLQFFPTLYYEESHLHPRIFTCNVSEISENLEDLVSRFTPKLTERCKDPQKFLKLCHKIWDFEKPKGDISYDFTKFTKENMLRSMRLREDALEYLRKYVEL